MDVRKAYESIYRGRCLEILRGYGLVPKLECLITHYWERKRILPKAVKFLRKAFGTGRGVTQGDPASPIIFNIMVYFMVRVVLGEV